MLAGLLLLAVSYWLWPQDAPAFSQPHGHHGGHVIEFSDGRLQFELTLDHKRRRMVVYVLESESHQPHPLTVTKLDATFKDEGREFDATFTADPQPEDPAGSSSRFALSFDELPQQLVSSNQFQLELSFTSNGEYFTGSMLHANDHAHEYHHD